MKFTKKLVILCFFIGILIINFSYSTNLLAKLETNNLIDNIDNQFLNSVNTLKKSLINKHGAKFKKLGLKFLTKNNRYIIAEEYIKVF